MKKYFNVLIIFVLFLGCEAFAYEKVLPMAPNIVETLYALEQGDKVIGIPMFTSYPQEALKKPVVGSYLNPSFEKIFKLQPDLIIVLGKFEKMSKFGKQYNIPVFHVDMDSINGIKKGISLISHKLDCREKGEKLLKKINDGLKIENNKTTPDVFICIGRVPGTLKQLFTPGGRSFISEVMELSGGNNIFSGLDKNYITISKEDLLVKNPDIIIDIQPGAELDPEKIEKIKSTWKKLGPVKAVKNNKIYVLNETFILSAGPRIIKTSRLFKSITGKAEIE